MGRIAFVVAMGLLALLGLFLASRAEDDMFAGFGYILFVFGVGTIYVMVHRMTDYSRHQHVPGKTGEASSSDPSM